MLNLAPDMDKTLPSALKVADKAESLAILNAKCGFETGWLTYYTHSKAITLIMAEFTVSKSIFHSH